MAAENFHSIDELTVKRHPWNIRVRVMRLWISTYEQIGFVAIDEKGGKIEGLIKTYLFSKFRDIIKEGSTYIMTKFAVGNNDGVDRATRHPCKINFLPYTSITEIEDIGIPRWIFDFVGAKDINGLSLDQNYLVDFIGHLVKVEGEYENNSVRVVVQLEDLEKEIVRVTLWGDYGRTVTAIAAESVRSPIVILSGAFVNIWNQSANLQTQWNKTFVLIDEDLPEVGDYKMSLECNDGGSATSDLSNYERKSFRDDYLNECAIKTIDYLNLKPEVGYHIIRAKVDSFDDGNWFYETCTKHVRGVSVITLADSGKEYYCADCDANVGTIIPRFRVQVLVADGTGSCSFILWGPDVQRLIKKSCLQLKKKQEILNNVTSVPEELKVLLGKEFLFKVEVSPWNEGKKNIALPVKGLTNKADVMAEFAKIFDKMQGTLEVGAGANKICNAETIVDRESDDKSGTSSCVTPPSNKGSYEIYEASTELKNGDPPSINRSSNRRQFEVTLEELD